MAAIKTNVRDGVLVISFLDPELSDELRIKQVGDEMIAQLKVPGTASILLDFTGVEFISSSMLGQLAVMSKKCGFHHFGFRLCNVAPEIREVLRIVRLDTMIPIDDEMDSALAEFRAGDTEPVEVASDLADMHRDAAAGGDPEAQFRLARCYDEGRGIDQDLAEAIKLYEQAAEQGHVEAQYALAMCHAYGIHVPQDYDEAMKWYQKSAEQGHAEAQYAMGMSYNFGIAVSADLDEAKKWYGLAAKQGHKKAAEDLRKMDD